MRLKIKLLYFLAISRDFVSSTSGIYSTDGTCKFSTLNFRILPQQYRIKHFLVRTDPALKQGEWNVVKLGNINHQGKCKRQRFKNIRIEANDPITPSTIPIMTDGIINVSLLALLPTR